MKKIILTTTALALFALPASAVSLQNKDSKAYDIKIKSSSSTSSTSIQAGTVKGSVCSSCKIIVKGVGEIDASGSDRVVIKNGRLSK